jgi:hypothetical protein
MKPITWGTDNDTSIFLSPKPTQMWIIYVQKSSDCYFSFRKPPSLIPHEEKKPPASKRLVFTICSAEFRDEGEPQSP